MQMITTPNMVVTKNDENGLAQGKRTVICRGIVRVYNEKRNCDASYDKFEKMLGR